MKVIEYGIRISNYFIALATLLFSNVLSAEVNYESTFEFVENKGQLTDIEGNVRADVLFYGEGGGKEIYLRKTGFSIVSSTINNYDIDAVGELSPFEKINAHRIDLDFFDPSPQLHVVTGQPTDGYHNYYYGHCKEGLTKVKGFRSIIYKNVQTGIDVVFYGGINNGLKYDVIIHPYADYEKFKFRLVGFDKAYLEEGNLLIETSLGMIQEKMPKVYQEVGDEVLDIEASYKLDGDLLAYKLSNFQKDLPITIDPWVTYYGGAKIERGDDVATDATGNVVASGRAMGAGFPTSAGAFQSTFAAKMDAFVLKFDANGNRLWATYFGGTEYDHAYGVTCDANDNIGVTGYTNSTDFPVSAGAFQTVKKGTYDAYVLKLDPAGARTWCTFLGGSGNENSIGYDIAVNNAGDFAVTGNSTSPDFPVTAGAFQAANGGGLRDAYVAVFSGAGAMKWATYLGGNDAEVGGGVSFDNAGNVFAVGNTVSNNFPATAGTAQVANAGAGDAYLVKFSPTGNQLWGTFFGGTGSEWGSAVSVDGAGNPVFTGWSNSLNFPVTAGAYQAVNNGIWDVYCVKLNANGQTLWSTYIGGSGNDEGFGITIDANDEVFLFGDTYCPDFPVTSCAYQTTFGGDEDFYVTRFDKNGNMICSGYLGDLGHDEANSNGHIAVSNGFIYVAATTPGPFPVTANAYQSSMAGGNDIILAKLCSNICGGVNPTKANFASDVNEISCGTEVNFTDLSVLCDTTGLTYEWNFPGASPSASNVKNPTNIKYGSSGSFLVTLILGSQCGADTLTVENYIKVDSLIAGVDAGTDQSIMLGNTVQLNPNATGTLQWQPSTGLSCDTCKNPIASPSETTTYYLSVIQKNGCTATDSMTVTVNICFDEQALFIPNSFTPNEDGVNDRFKIFGNEVYTFEMRIYNRWGNEVFRSSSIDDSWNGTVNGFPAPIDVYVYHIVYSSVCSEGKTVENIGHVSIIK